MLVLHRLVRPLLTVVAVGVLATVAVAAVRGPDTRVSTADPVAAVSGDAPALVGTVVDGAGAPVDGASVVPAAVGGGQPVPDLVVTTAADGTFRWALRAGRYAVTAVAGERSSQPVEVEVPDSGTAQVRLVLG